MARNPPPASWFERLLLGQGDGVEWWEVGTAPERPCSSPGSSPCLALATQATWPADGAFAEGDRRSQAVLWGHLVAASCSDSRREDCSGLGA